MRTMRPITTLALILLAGAVATTPARATAFPGPDTFGYQGLEVPVVALNGVSPSSTVELLDDDELTGAIPLGFSFDFYGTTYTQVYISSNGFLTFDPNSGALCCDGESLPDPNTPFPIIAGWWGNSDPAREGVVAHETRGSAGSREFIAGFYGVRDIYSPLLATFTFEIILHEGSNEIEVLYGVVQTGGQTRTRVAGMQNEDGTVGLEILFAPPGANSDGDVAFDGQGYIINTTGSFPKCGGMTVTIKGSGSSDLLEGTAGDDVIIGGGSSDIIIGGDGNDVICGGSGDDVIQGGAGNDRIFGEGGNDSIRGGSGNDRMNGGPGADICDGGPGRSDRAGSCELIQRVP